jgi:hypothetical protein
MLLYAASFQAFACTHDLVLLVRTPLSLLIKIRPMALRDLSVGPHFIPTKYCSDLLLHPKSKKSVSLWRQSVPLNFSVPIRAYISDATPGSPCLLFRFQFQLASTPYSLLAAAHGGRGTFLCALLPLVQVFRSHDFFFLLKIVPDDFLENFSYRGRGVPRDKT